MSPISQSRAVRILEGAYNWLKEIDPNEMTTFELNLWRELRDAEDKTPLPSVGSEKAIMDRE